MSPQCLTKSEEIIFREGGDNQVVRVIDHSVELEDAAFSDGMDLHLDGISVCLEDEGRDSAILGLQVHLAGNDDVH